VRRDLGPRVSLLFHGAWLKSWSPQGAARLRKILCWCGRNPAAFRARRGLTRCQITHIETRRDPCSATWACTCARAGISRASLGRRGSRASGPRGNAGDERNHAAPQTRPSHEPHRGGPFSHPGRGKPPRREPRRSSFPRLSPRRRRARTAPSLGMLPPAPRAASVPPSGESWASPGRRDSQGTAGARRPRGDHESIGGEARDETFAVRRVRGWARPGRTRT
jgi:hypothetical protein